MFIGDLGDTIHVKLKKHFLDLQPFGQQISDQNGNKNFFMLAINKFNAARVESWPQVCKGLIRNQGQ